MTEAEMVWQLSGQLIETCSCNMFCPCWFLAPGGGFISALNMPFITLASSSSNWNDPDLRNFQTKSGALGNFSWNG
jgi:hypothetical protein